MLAQKYRPYLTALLGFLLAWFLKPSHKNSAQDEASTSNKNLSAQSLAQAEEDKKRVGMPTPAETKGVSLVKDIPAAIAAARAEMANSLSNNLARRDNAFVNRLTEVLGLSAEQQTEILTLLETKREALNIMTDHGAGFNFAEQGEIREKKFQEALAKVLDAAQVEKYNQFREAQAQNRVNAVAQREFANIIDRIDLSSDQQDKVLSALAGDAKGNYDAVADKSRLFADSYDALGFGSAVTRYSDVSTANQSIIHSTNPEETMRQVAQERLQETENKLHLLKSILSPAQYNQYKAMLDNADQQFLASLAPMVQQRVNLNMPPPKNLPEMPKEEPEEIETAPPAPPEKEEPKIKYVEQDENEQGSE